MFRRLYGSLIDLIERSRVVYEGKGELNQSAPLWRFKNGALIEFGAIQYEQDWEKYRGRPHDLYCWDEVTEFSESQFRFVNAWNRTAIKGQRCRIVATGNPPSSQEGQWVKKYWGAWLDPKHAHPAKEGDLRWYHYDGEKDIEVESGERFIDKKTGLEIIPRSRTFIAAKLIDNPYVNEEYRGLLQGLPEPLRSQLLYGDMSIGEKDDEWQLIPTAWIWEAQTRWRQGKPNAPLASIGVDLAYGGGDNMVIAKLYDSWLAPFITYRGKDVADGEQQAYLAIKEMDNGCPLGFDSIGVGAGFDTGMKNKGIPYRKIDFSRGTEERTRMPKKTYGFMNVRAECYWRLREALDPAGEVKLCLPDDPELVSELAAVRWNPQAGKIKIMPKDEIKELLGRSPDKADALAIAYKCSLKKDLTLHFA